jgi:pimeloyl-ACP methyl ester carboxylesterase
LVLLLVVPVAACRVQVGEGDVRWNRWVSPHRKFADFQDYRMHYVDMGRGRPVLMVHGFADSSYCWHANARPLVDAGFRVVLVDQPGLGRSEIPPEGYLYSMENQAAQVIRLADRLQLNRFSLVGHSMGGGIVLYLCLRHPGRVDRAVVLDPACYRPPRTALLSIPGAVPVAKILAGRWLVKLGLLSAYLDSKMVNDALVDEYARAFQKPGYVNVLAALSTQYFSEQFTRMGDDYERISTSLMILWGDHDSWIPPEYGSRLHKRIRDSRLHLIRQAGHCPHQEQAAAVNPLLVGFLTGH